MALNLLIRAQMDSTKELASACFTKQNYGANAAGNSTLSVNTPYGVLGGSIAAVSAGGGDYTVYPCDKTAMPVGLFANDAAGAAFDNSPALASNKIAVVKAYASVEVDVYETKDVSGSDITYSIGDNLYSSKDGLLTNEKGAASVVIGVVTKVPTVSSPTLGLDMRI